MKRVYIIAVIYGLIFLQTLLTRSLNAQGCWSALDAGIGANPNFDAVLAMSTYNDNLIVAGVFDIANGQTASDIAMWNGNSWAPLGAGIKGAYPPNSVNSLAVYHNELYIGGVFDTVGGIAAKNIAKWNGTSWSAVAAGVGGNYSSVISMATYNGLLYVAGYFDTAGGIPVHNIAMWNDTLWSDVGGGLHSLYSYVECLTPFSGKLFAGGQFDSAGSITATNIASWNGTAWSALQNGIGTSADSASVVYAIAAYQGDLYVAGSNLSTASGTTISNISKWTGTLWEDVDGGISGGAYLSVNTLLALNGEIIVAGSFTTAGTQTVTNIAAWNGVTWSSFSGGTSGGITSIDTFNANLYVAGAFGQAGGIGALNIAQYSCNTSSVEDNSLNNKIHVFPNPTNGRVNFSIENLQGMQTIQIYNLLGQRIHQSNLNNGKNEIDLIGEANGTYLYRIYGGNGEYIASGSFVIQ